MGCSLENCPVGVEPTQQETKIAGKETSKRKWPWDRYTHTSEVCNNEVKRFYFFFDGYMYFPLEPVSGSERVGTSRKQGQGKIGRAWNRLFRHMNIYINSYLPMVICF